MDDPKQVRELQPPHGTDGHVRPASEWKGKHSPEEAIASPVRGQDTTLQDPRLIEEERMRSLR